MKYARIIDDNADFVINPKTGAPFRLGAEQFQTKLDAENFLDAIAKTQGLTGLKYCCGHGACQSLVHFREESKMVGGKHSRARAQTWVSSDVKSHVANCPGPNEREMPHTPHNGLSLSQAIHKTGEYILFHLNVDVGKTSRNEFNSAAHTLSEDLSWRRAHKDNHSYFAISTMAELTSKISQIYTQGDKEALRRTKIAHEGRLIRLEDFIVRNNAENRLAIIDGLKAKAHRQIHCGTRHPRHDAFVFDRPYLVMFESAQNDAMAKHPTKQQYVRGWRYEVQPGVQVYDQLHLNKTGLAERDIPMSGALVLARPFIPVQQNPKYPMVHWSVQNEDNIDLSPSAEIIKILCWDGQHIPQNRKARQLKLDL